MLSSCRGMMLRCCKTQQSLEGRRRQQAGASPEEGQRGARRGGGKQHDRAGERWTSGSRGEGRPRATH
eukprot:11917869-Alexandrium_andersonii.AAC.1